MVRMDCTHSPTCSADHRFPEAELDVLAWWIRNHPVEGDAYDANGNPVHVLIDEETLLNSLVANPIGNFTNTGELLAAASALWRGDSVPLLRLGAEFHLTLESDMGDPTGFSTGAMLATWNVDMEAPWDWSRPIPVRQAQYDAAAAALPPWYFAPFSKQVGTGLLFDYGLQGLWWEVPTLPSLVVPRHARYPHVPTLVLSGDMDQAIAYELSRPYADLFPDSVFIPVAGAGHGTFIWSSCAARLASEFIRTLKVADSRCAHTPDVVWPAVGRFPLLAREARPADPDRTGENAIGLAERKVVTVAVAAATDAMQRSIIGWGSGVGLRGWHLLDRLRRLHDLDGDPHGVCLRRGCDGERHGDLEPGLPGHARQPRRRVVHRRSDGGRIGDEGRHAARPRQVAGAGARGELQGHRHARRQERGRARAGGVIERG